MTGLTLAGEFAAAGHEAWVERAMADLKGRPLHSLDARTYDGIVIAPVAARAKGPAPLPLHGRGWQTMQRIDMPDPGAANRQALEDLEGGAEGLSLVWPESLAAGAHGVSVCDERGMARLFEGVDLDLIRLRLDGGRFGRPAAALAGDVYKSRNLDMSRAQLSLCLDPLGAFALTGKLVEPQALAGSMAETFRRLDDAGHKGDIVAADARVWHGAGASEAQELGLALAAAVQYLRLLETGGIAPEAAFSRIGLVLSADADQFMTIAKFRAARLLWARLAEVLGRPAGAVMVHGETSLRMMTRRDPHVNLLRTTTAAFAAGIGGADTVTVLPFTAALGLADAFARRMARNIQSILKEESGIGEVADAAAGSGHVEALTLALAEKGWEIFRDIEKTGGLIATLIAGRVQAMIAEVARRRAGDIARRKVGLTGLSEFPDSNERPVKVLAMDLPRDWAKGSGFAMPGGDAGILACTPVEQTRAGAAFETLRDAADAITGKTGRRPAVFLANLGGVADFTGRATWMGNLLAAGGIAALAGDDCDDAPGAVEAFRASGARIACLCSSDAVYDRLAASTAKALKRAGAAEVVLAGRPGEREADLRAAGIDRFAFAGMDVVAFLDHLLSATGNGEDRP